MLKLTYARKLVAPKVAEGAVLAREQHGSNNGSVMETKV